MKNKEVIEKILQYHPPMAGYEGCDGYKSGDPDAECTGVVCALVPTVEVIRKAAALGANLIITHEPIYYMTPDFPQWRGPFENRVYEEKRAILQEKGITVWRDHDHIHVHQPDGIFTGVLKYLGWEDYYRPDTAGACLPADRPLCHRDWLRDQWLCAAVRPRENPGSVFQ